MILGGLEVKRADEKASVLDLSFACGSATDCQSVLQAIIASYEDFLKETHNNISKETVELITQAKETLLTELQRKENAYREFREAAPLIWTKEGSFNVHQARLNQIEATRSGLIISRSQTKAQLQALEAAIERGGSREAILLMMDKSTSPVDFGNGTGKISVAGTLFPLLLEEQMLLEDYGPDHPKIRAIRKRIDITRKHLRSSGIEEPMPGDDPQKKAGSTDFVTVYLDSLREDIRSVDERQKELNDLFVVEAEEAKKLSNYEVKDETLRQDIARTHQLFEGVVKRLEEINLIQDYGKMKTRVLNNATLGWQIAPVMSRLVGLAGTMGFFAGCALAFLLELADKRFRSPEEITEKLGVPVIGHIPYYKPEKSRRGICHRWIAMRLSPPEIESGRGLSRNSDRTVFQHAGRRPQSHSSVQPESGRREIDHGGQPGSRNRSVGETNTDRRIRLSAASSAQTDGDRSRNRRNIGHFG